MHVLVHLEGVLETGTMQDVAGAMGAGVDEHEGLNKLASEYLRSMHESPQDRAKMCKMGQLIEAGLESSGFQGFDRVEWAKGVTSMCIDANNAWMVSSQQKHKLIERGLLATKMAVLPAG